MAEAIKIAAESRTRAGKGAARAARRAGRIPGVIYGNRQPPAMIELDPAALLRQLQQPGFFTRVLDVEVGGKAEQVLPRDVQFHKVTDRPQHVDFMRVGADTEIRVRVPVEFINQDKSPGLKRGGVLNIVRHTVEVYCLASQIPERFSFDLGGRNIGDSIHISSIKLPEGVRPTISDRDFTVATVAAPSVLKTAEEEAADAAKVAAAAAAATPAAAAAPADAAAKKEPAKKEPAKK